MTVRLVLTTIVLLWYLVVMGFPQAAPSQDQRLELSRLKHIIKDKERDIMLESCADIWMRANDLERELASLREKLPKSDKEAKGETVSSSR